jgi:hypothetical protein
MLSKFHFQPHRANTTPTQHEAQLELHLFYQDTVYRTESSAIKAQYIRGAEK